MAFCSISTLQSNIKYNPTNLTTQPQLTLLWNNIHSNVNFVETVKRPDNISISNNGTYLLCNAYDGTNIYISSNKGVSWTTIIDTLKIKILGMSPTGQYMYISNANNFLYSSNYGVTWTSYPSVYYNLLSISQTGQYLVASQIGNTAIYYSSNYGVSFTNINTNISSVYRWSGVSISSDGTYIVAFMITANQTNGIVYYSSNIGATWTNISSTIGSLIRPNSTSGNLYGNYTIKVSTNGQIILISTTTGAYLTTNAGSSWIQVSSQMPNTSIITSGISMSDNGQIMIMIPAYGNNIGYDNYVSLNNGQTWTPSLLSITNNIFGVCQSVSVSPDGSYIVWTGVKKNPDIWAICITS